MNVSPKLKFLLLLLPLLHFTAFGQQRYESSQDEEFNIFLLLFATIFVCGLFGAAVVGATLAALLAAVVFGLIAAGILSTSIALAVYKKSASTGFKTFLLMSFGVGCGLCGAALASVVQYNWPVAPSFVVSVALGFIGGALGGIGLTLISFKAVRYTISQAFNKLRPS